MSFDATVLALLLLAAVGWFWHVNLRVRERATRLARQACDRQQLQFLEGTVALRSMRPCRDDAGRLTLQRTYLFDYSDDGVRRQQGFVIFSGERLDSVGLANDARPPDDAG